MKERYIAAHEAEIAEYMERYPNATWSQAYERTADSAYGRMAVDLAERVDYQRMKAKERL